MIAGSGVQRHASSVRPDASFGGLNASSVTTDAATCIAPVPSAISAYDTSCFARGCLRLVRRPASWPRGACTTGNVTDLSVIGSSNGVVGYARHRKKRPGNVPSDVRPQNNCMYHVCRIIRLFVVATLSIATVSGCSQTLTAPPAHDLQMIGIVQRIHLGDPESQVLVNIAMPLSSQDNVTQPTSALLNVFAGSTVIMVSGSGGTLHRGTAGELTAGMRIRAWVGSTELRSFPPQYSAAWIEVSPGPVTR